MKIQWSINKFPQEDITLENFEKDSYGRVLMNIVREFSLRHGTTSSLIIPDRDGNFGEIVFTVELF